MPEPFRGCWSFCTPDCQLRAINSCRKLIPRYDLPPPNEGVDSICYLKHGRQDYDGHPAKEAWYKERGRWWSNGQVGPEPTHWRQRVGDKWAGIYIHEDPEFKNGFNQCQLYDPLLLQDLLLESPRIIRAIHAAIEADADVTSMRRVQRELMSFWRVEFREALISTGKFDQSHFERRVLKFLEHTVDLIAQCLLVNYELYPIEWSLRVLKHAEVSDKWKARLESLTPVKPKVEMAVQSQPNIPGLQIEPVQIKGLTYE